MLNRLSNREKIMLIIAFCIWVIGLYYLLLYQPMQKEINQLLESKLQKENELLTARMMAKKLPSLKEKYTELTQSQKQQVFDGNITSEGLLRGLNNLSRENKVQLIDFYPDEQEDRIKVKLLIGGQFKTITNFLTSLEKWDLQMDFNSLKLQPAQDALALDLNLIFYKYK